MDLPERLCLWVDVVFSAGHLTPGEDKAWNVSASSSKGGSAACAQVEDSVTGVCGGGSQEGQTQASLTT